MTTTYKIVDLRAPELREALTSRAARLETRIMELGLGATGVVWPEGTALETARYYRRMLGQGNTETAGEILRVLVDETEAYGSQFWSTELGQALFLLGAFPIAETSREVARVVLGLKNRQHIHHLIQQGLLVETMGGTITTESIRSLMKAK
jgi:hypothetical protein